MPSLVRDVSLLGLQVGLLQQARVLAVEVDGGAVVGHVGRRGARRVGEEVGQAAEGDWRREAMKNQT